MDNNVIFQDINSKISIEALYCIGGYVTYEVLISTGKFSGICNFCIAENTVKEYVEKVDRMLQTLGGELEITDSESDSHLKVRFENPMNFYVSGQIGGSHRYNSLRFKLKADQTMLHGLKKSLLNY